MTATTALRYPSPSGQRDVRGTNVNRLTPTITLARSLLAIAAVGVAAAGLLSQSIESSVIVAIVTSVISLLLTGTRYLQYVALGTNRPGGHAGGFMDYAFHGSGPERSWQLTILCARVLSLWTVRRRSHSASPSASLSISAHASRWFRHPWRYVGVKPLVCASHRYLHGRLMLQVALAACIPLSFGSTYGWNWSSCFTLCWDPTVLG